MKLTNIGKLLYTSILSFLLFGVADSAKSVAFTVYYDVRTFIHEREDIRS